MYSIWEIQQLVTERHDTMVRDATRHSLRRRLREAPSRVKDVQAAGGRRGWLTALLGHWLLRGPEAAGR
jgi:hypothetical protein